jgi:hypothetical protein
MLQAELEASKVEMQSDSKFPVIMQKPNGTFVKEYENKEDLVRDGYNYDSVIKCCEGRQKEHKKHKFKFK